jgi:hypothetical protein
MLSRLVARMDLDALGVPAVCDWHRYIQLDGDALGNDMRSNCVPCGALRRVQIARAVVAGDMRRPTTADALALYRAWAGWDGTDATDIGTPSDQAALRWAAEGIRWGDQWEDVPSIATLDPANLDHMCAAIAYLGPVQVDLALPTSARGVTSWSSAVGPDGAPGSWGDHRVCVGRYDGRTLYAITWGIEVAMTAEFIARYGINAEATVSRSWLDVTGLSPFGLDLAGLEQDARLLMTCI